ncbi:creatinine amidohydrolase [Paenibacillus cellulosilyticus]|uniref:Creatinine amidohydrolase n=1 Tax=Paenibacillus cellulosilyticus TaxID=375489 RepID=A0A2V2YQB1_9BACL|nr:creatininase family protein [Paenibacillus cellulosilyticus]PWV95835.1 creatinine amidohydrolase [Paenibacillus cellulosilyticus]QKS47712.1 creatininase family protein [Paenibacillus cellulosilyticus]
MRPSTGSKALWSELLPHEFHSRLKDNSTVYLPLGLCEPHGQVSAFGLDTIKAEWLCERAALRIGGIVAPSMGYHIHESGYHARWLEDEVGDHNPCMTGIPPAIMLHLFLYQLRAFVNAGFRTIIVVSGHSGGNQIDLRRAADLFMQRIPVRVWVRSDPELVEGQFEGDHAGKYEISQQMYLRPDLIDMSARAFESEPGSGGRLALGSDADEASPEHGKLIMEACLDRLCIEADRMKRLQSNETINPISYSVIESIMSELLQSANEWVTAQPWPGQAAVSSQSRWKPYERYAPDRNES